MDTLALQQRPPGPDREPSRRAGRRWLGWLIAASILLGCLLFLDPREIAAALGRLSPPELGLLLLLATLDRVLMGLKWGLLLHLLDVRLPFTRAVRLFYQGCFVGAFMPVHIGGDLLRAYWVAREERGSGHRVLASLVMERLLGLVSAANVALLGGVLLARQLAPGHGPALIGLGVLVAAGGNALFALSLAARTHGFVLGRLGRLSGSKLGGMLHRFYAAYAAFGRRRRGLLLAAGLTVAEHGLQILLMYATALSLDIAVGPVAFAAAAALHLLITRLPLAPDGLGVSELTAMGAFGLVGVSAAAAFSLSLVGHVVPLLALAPGASLLLLARDRAEPAPSAPRPRDRAGW